MKKTQKEENPFPYSDTNKRYYTYDYYLRRTFGGKCVKIPLDAGFTCPNIDGKCGTGGCIYCSGNGSGDFTASAALPIAEQYRLLREQLSKKWNTDRCIAYFQPHTNTYAPLDRLLTLYEEALALPGVVGLNIATRADCIGEGLPEALEALTKRTVVTLELGLQTVHDETAWRINRGHSYQTFEDAFRLLRKKAPSVRLCVHLIFGLIGENDEMMVETVQRVAELHPDEVKIHCQYVLKNTVLAKMYGNGAYFPLSEEAYVRMVVRALEMLPEDIVIGRLTGDGASEELIAPLWTRRKREALNEIDKKIYAENTRQGKERI